MDADNTELLHGLYGSQVSKGKAVGMCRYHRTVMTAKTLKQHGCLCKHGKHCDALEKYEEHDYWRQRTQKKENKKNAN